MITINYIMKAFNVTQKDICEKFDIPYRTIQNWSGGVSAPPQYVLNLILESYYNEDRIETITRDIERQNDILDRASDLLHDSRYREAMSLIDNA